MFVRVVDADPGPGARAAGRAERSYEIQTIAPRRYRLRLWGALPEGWAQGLASGLAGQGIGIVRGHASRAVGAGEAGSAWLASFEVERLQGGRNPILVDVLGLLGRRSPTAPEVRLDHFRIHPSARHGGSLFLEVLAPDQAGFLSALLERLTFLQLVPEEMHVETGPGGVFDRFYLKTRAGERPGRVMERVLAEVLEGRICTLAARAS